MKKHPSLVGIACIASSALFLAAACGDSGSDGGEASDDTLRVWFPGNLAEEIELLEDTLIPQFEEEHGLNVQVEFVDWGDLATRLSTAFAGGTAPDIFGHGNAAAAQYAANERVISLDGYLSEMAEDEVADLTFLDEGKVDGEQIIMPLRGFGHLLAYRTDLFEDAGLNPEEPPSDWGSLRSDAEALTVRDGNKITRSGLVMSTEDQTSMSQAFSNFFFQAGGEFLSSDGASVAWDSDAGHDALEFLTGLYVGDGAVSNGIGEKISNSGGQHPLVTERAAMAFIDEATLKTIYEQSPDVAEKIRVAAPITGTETAAFGGAGNGLFISADSELQDAAWEFIKFLIEPESAKSYVETVGGIPARASLAEDPDLASIPYIKPYMDAAESFRGNPNIEEWTEIRDILGGHIEAAMRGAETPTEALEESTADANGVLSE